MTKKEIIEMYIADLNNLVADSDAKRSRIIDLEDELEALRQLAVISSGKICPKCNDQGWLYDEEGNRTGTCPCHYL